MNFGMAILTEGSGLVTTTSGLGYPEPAYVPPPPRTSVTCVHGSLVELSPLGATLVELAPVSATLVELCS